MSVIFQSLQKLKAQADEDIRPAMHYKKQSRKFSLPKGRFVSLRIVTLVILMFISAIGTSYGIYKVRGNTENSLSADDATGKPSTAVDPQPERIAAFIPQKKLEHPRKDNENIPASKKGEDRRVDAANSAGARSIPRDSATGSIGVESAAQKEDAFTAAAHTPTAVKLPPRDVS